MSILRERAVNVLLQAIQVSKKSRNSQTRDRILEMCDNSRMRKFLEKDRMIFSHAIIITHFENTVPETKGNSPI